MHRIYSGKQNTRIPVAPCTASLFLCRWRFGAHRSSPSTCPQEPEALSRPLALWAPPPPLSSCRTPTFARSLRDSAIPLSCASPLPSLPALQPVDGGGGGGGGLASAAFDQSHFIRDIRAPLRSSNNREIALPCFEMFSLERSNLSLFLSAVIASTSYI